MIQDLNHESIVYLNGDYLPINEAKISVLDRGFIFGDGIYDVVPSYKRKPFRIEQHIARLQRSLKAISLQTNKTKQDWIELVSRMIALTPTDNSIVYLQVTRGVAKRDHSFPNPPVKPTIFSMSSAFICPSEEQRTKGLKAVSMLDQRWLHCDIKSISLLGNVLAKQYAVENQVDEVIQFRDGFLTEGASCNIWLVKNGTLLAPVRNNLILEGIRYQLLIELAQENNIPFEARALAQHEVEQADELLLTSASKEVLPIVEYNGKPVGAGVAGPIYKKLRTAYDEAIARL